MRWVWYRRCTATCASCWLTSKTSTVESSGGSYSADCWTLPRDPIRPKTARRPKTDAFTGDFRKHSNRSLPILLRACRNSNASLRFILKCPKVGISLRLPLCPSSEFFDQLSKFTSSVDARQGSLVLDYSDFSVCGFLLRGIEILLALEGPFNWFLGTGSSRWAMTAVPHRPPSSSSMRPHRKRVAKVETRKIWGTTTF